MPSDKDILIPTPFEVAKKESDSRATAESQTQRKLILLIVLLGLSTIFVVLGLPALLTSDKFDAEVPPNVSSTENSNSKSHRPNTKDETSSPWADAVMEKSRKHALAIASQVAEAQSQLEEIGVQAWAKEKFIDAKTKSAQADKAYGEKEFGLASVKYQAALDTLVQLRNSAPQKLEDTLIKLQLAIDSGNLTDAVSLSQLAVLMKSDSLTLEVLLRRATSLPQVLEALKKSKNLEKLDRLAEAADTLEEARKIDPDHPIVLKEWKILRSKLNHLQFNKLISMGYQALEKKDFTKAQKHFADAKQIKSSAEEVRVALEELKESELQFELVRLRRETILLERQENWIDAETRLLEALGKDENLMFANEGLARIKPRVILDLKLEALIEDPEKLRIRKIALEASTILSEAKKIPKPGPRLESQIARLNALITEANTKIKVQIFSDNTTNVKVYRVAELGRFTNHELFLRPGNYTIVGHRNGFRDVRQTFEVSAGIPPIVLHVKCEEAIE